MLKRLALNYWPIVLLVILIGAVFCMSRYAEDCKTKHKDNAQGCSPNPVIPPNGNTQGAQNANKSHQCPSWIYTFTWPEGATAWALFVTLIVIGWQSAETRKSAEATRTAVETAGKSLALQERTAKQQLRAYLVVRNAHLILHEDGAVEAKVELVNCGQTPAYDLRGAMICKFTVYPVRDVQPIQDDLRKSAGTLGAGLGNWILYPIGRHDKGNREHLLRRFDEIKGLVYYAHGHYTYRDIFNDLHWFKFQLIVGGPAGLRVDSDGVRHWASFSNDSEGNEEDQPPNPN